MSLVYVCEQVNTTTQACEAGVWVDTSVVGQLPPLTETEAAAIASAVVVFWCICAVLRILRQELAKL